MKQSLIVIGVLLAIIAAGLVFGYCSRPAFEFTPPTSTSSTVLPTTSSTVRPTTSTTVRPTTTTKPKPRPTTTTRKPPKKNTKPFTG